MTFGINIIVTIVANITQKLYSAIKLTLYDNANVGTTPR